ncbi:MAG TPA: serine protease [Rhabdochlamydiaceae bacterium]|nr:serine protease [Rhabdochlamydiaceae bacterium]
MNKLFTLLFFFASLKLGALQYPIFEGVSLENDKNSTPISTQSLDKLTEDVMQTICLFVYEEAPDWATWAKQWWNLLEYSPRTAFFITPDGHFITNKRLINSQFGALAFLQQKGIFVKASIIAEHPTEDIALLKIDKPNDMTLSYLNIASNKEDIGNWIFSLRGCTYISDNETVVALPSIGKIMGYSHVYAISSIASVKGNAGSPVLNVEGKAIGILSRIVNLDDPTVESGMSAILPLHHLKNWIEEALRSSGYVEPLK